MWLWMIVFVLGAVILFRGSRFLQYGGREAAPMGGEKFAGFMIEMLLGAGLMILSALQLDAPTGQRAGWWLLLVTTITGLILPFYAVIGIVKAKRARGCAAQCCAK